MKSRVHRVHRRLGGTGVIAAATVAVLALAAAPAAAGPLGGRSRVGGPAVVLDRHHATAIAGQFIVVLRADAARPAAGAAGRARRLGARVHAEYEHALRGFSAQLDGPQLEALRSDPDVDVITADQVVSAYGTQSPATWGIDRIDQRSLPLDNSYTWGPDGTGVTVYVIDTGIRTSHAVFGGRASGGYTAVADGRGTSDCNGHGTHVAGTVGGSTYGVARNVRLVAVRVLGCGGTGTASGVIAGVEWVTANRRGPAVANMSLGGRASTALDQAVSAAIAAGVVFVAAAGNAARDACGYSPARVPAVITVGASTRTDRRDTGYSNYGSCLDLFAPGSSVTSAWSTTDTATRTISGTSMAAPHVAGVAALRLQADPSASPAAVAASIAASATPDVLSSVGSGSPNRLLYAR